MNDATAKLQSIIDLGRAKAATAINYIQDNVPQDALLAMPAAHFSDVDHVRLNDRELTRHALGQACGRVGFPAGYAADIIGTDVGRRVVSGALNQLWHADTRRVLTRTVQGKVHGIMSDSFRRIDCRPLVEAFANAAARIGAVPVDGVVTDTRLAIKAVFPEPFLVGGRDAVALGVVLRNSDFGAGAFSISAYVMRLLCLNGMIGEKLFQQRHLGGRLEEADFFSERTHRLDAATMTSSTVDYVTGLLGADGRQRTVELLERAATERLDPEAELGKLRLSKAESGLVRSALQSVDEAEMPLGPPSPYRMANAIGWAAGQVTDADRKLDLERLAGEYLKAA